MPSPRKKPAATAKRKVGKKKVRAKKAVSKKAAKKKAAKKVATAATPASDKKAEDSKSQGEARLITSIDDPEIKLKLKALIRLAKEQGCLTYDDLNESLPNGLIAPDIIDEILDRLRGMEFEIVDSAELDLPRKKPSEQTEQEEATPKASKTTARKKSSAATSNDSLDDPVRQYLKQMGKVPLLTREEEIEISKRIEVGEANVQKFLGLFSFTASCYQEMARKLLEGEERIDRVTIDKKVTNRDRYVKNLPKLCDRMDEAHRLAATTYQAYSEASNKKSTETARTKFEKALHELNKIYRKFHFKQKVTEEFTDRAEEAAAILQEIPKNQKSALAEFAMHTWLNAEEFQEAHQQLRNALEQALRAKTEMVEANLRLVISIAKKYTNRGLSFLDLIQEGNMGLMKAVEKFEYQRGYKFSTYATWWIRQAITRSIADQARTIRIPVHMIETINKLMRVQKQLVQEYGREPTSDEIADEIHLPASRVRAVLKMAQQPISLQAPVGDGEDSSFGDFIEDKSASSPHEETSMTMLKDKIVDILDSLTEREREVLEQRFGLVDGYGRTLEEVGKQFQVTRERIRQIEAKALRKMRHPTRLRQLEGYIEVGQSN